MADTDPMRTLSNPRRTIVEVSAREYHDTFGHLHKVAICTKLSITAALARTRVLLRICREKMHRRGRFHAAGSPLGDGLGMSLRERWFAEIRQAGERSRDSLSFGFTYVRELRGALARWFNSDNHICRHGAIRDVA